MHRCIYSLFIFERSYYKRKEDVCSGGKFFLWYSIWQLSVYWGEEEDEREKKKGTDGIRISSSASYTEWRKRKIESASPPFPAAALSRLVYLGRCCRMQKRRMKYRVCEHDAWNSFENSFVIRDARFTRSCKSFRFRWHRENNNFSTNIRPSSWWEGVASSHFPSPMFSSIFARRIVKFSNVIQTSARGDKSSLKLQSTPGWTQWMSRERKHHYPLCSSVATFDTLSGLLQTKRI